MIIERIPPGPSRLIENLSNIGYDLNAAVADLIDNSIAWSARNIHVEIRPRQKNEASLVQISDDGLGMDKNDLKEGMRYASEQNYKENDLRKFGLGLKTASLTLCDILTVFTKRKNKDIYIARWDKAFVKEQKDWCLQFLENKDLNNYERNLASFLIKEGKGTVVVWNNLKNMDFLDEIHKNENNKEFENTCDDLRKHLGMVYNELPLLSLKVNGVDVVSWDPFCRAEKKTKRLRKVVLPIQKGTKKTIKVVPYILPRKDEFSCIEAWKEATGPKKWNGQQGFYFYRNGRMIKSGGWSNCKGRIEEHNKLLRIMIMFNSNSDSEFGVNITKARASIPFAIKNKVLGLLKKWRAAASLRYNRGRKHKTLKKIKVQKTQILFSQNNKRNELEINKNKITIHYKSKNLMNRLKQMISGPKPRIVSLLALFYYLKNSRKDKRIEALIEKSI